MSDSFETPWTVALQAPLSTGFSKREYWSGCHALLQGIFPDPGIEPCLFCLLRRQAASLPLRPQKPQFTRGSVQTSVLHSVQCSLSFPCRAHKSILQLHSCGHSFLTLTQKREQGVSATPILSVKGTEVLGVRSLWFHPLSKTQIQTRSASSYCVGT